MPTPPPIAAPPRPGTRRRWLLGTGAALGLAGLGATLAQRLLPPQQRDPAVAALLSRTLPDAHGQPWPLERYRGHALIVNAWATWCPPCLEEMPELAALTPALSAQGVHLIGLGIDHAAAIANYATQHPTPYPLLVAGLAGMNLLHQLGATPAALPWTAFITRHGTVARRIAGRLDTSQLLEQARELV